MAGDVILKPYADRVRDGRDERVYPYYDQFLAVKIHMPPVSEYNALALFHQGNHAKLRALWERHRDWRAAWNEAKSAAHIDPTREWQRLLAHDVRLILCDDPNFPSALREIHDAPFALYTKGSFAFESPAVAVVGTRRATREGARIAHDLARALADRRIAVISGLALGIDGAAHRGTLASRARPTVAVLPCGLDRTYPPAHTGLAREIVAAGGALVSEYPFGTPSYPAHFLERNRIVAGLAQATLVVEAPERSGALVTARLALEQNRDVLVVPGPIAHPNYAGSHGLIRQGAGLVTCAAHICEALGLPDDPIPQKSPEADPARTPAERAVLSALREAGTALSLDAIAEAGHLEAARAAQAAAILTVHGIITDTDGLYSL